MKAELTINVLLEEAAAFAHMESEHAEPALYGVTDGKAVGAYLEHKFTAHLMEFYSFANGNSAAGIDIPSVNVDIKVTSIKQPQSSCPYKSARQKIFGLGYHLIVFVYEKTDDNNAKTGRLDIQNTIFVAKNRTADYQMTRGLLEILDRDGNEDDIVAFINDRRLPVAERVLRRRRFTRLMPSASSALRWMPASSSLQLAPTAANPSAVCSKASTPQNPSRLLVLTATI